MLTLRRNSSYETASEKCKFIRRRQTVVRAVVLQEHDSFFQLLTVKASALLRAVSGIKKSCSQRSKSKRSRGAMCIMCIQVWMHMKCIKSVVLPLASSCPSKLVRIFLGMLPEIAAETLHFLSRRDLDEACGVSKWLDTLIAQTCEMYPLRAVLFVRLDWCGKEFKLYVSTFGGKYASTRHSFASMDEAVRFSTLRVTSFFQDSLLATTLTRSIIFNIKNVLKIKVLNIPV